MKLITDEQIIEALQLNHGLIKLVAISLDVSRELIYQRIRKSETLREALQDSRESLIDIVESRLINSAMNSEPWAVQFLLKSIAKNRGYGDSQNISISGQMQTEQLPPQIHFENYTIEDLEFLQNLLKKGLNPGETIEGEYSEKDTSMDE